METCLKTNRCASRYLLALLAAPLLCPFALPLARADKASEVKARTEADAKVAAAQDSIEKINAYYLRGRLAGYMEDPDTSDWKKAGADELEASRLIDEYEKDGKHVVNGKTAIYFQQGYIAEHLGKYQEAIAAYDKSEKAGYAKAYANGEWKGSELWDNRGLDKESLFDYDGAIADYKAAIALFDEAKYHQHLANTLYEKGDILFAIVEKKRALEMDATLSGMDFDAEQAPLNKAIYENPKQAAPLIARARYIFKKVRDTKSDAKNKYEKQTLEFLYGDSSSLKADALEPALNDLNRAVKVEPNSAAPFIERGRMRLVYVNLQDSLINHAFEYKDTQKDFDKALELNPKNAEAWFESGMAHLVLWKKESNDILSLGTPAAEKAAHREQAMHGAIADFSHAIALKPDAAGEAHFQRASIEKQQKNLDYNALLIDYSAAIAQNMAPLDADWSALLRPDAKPDPRTLSDAHLMRSRIFMSRGQFAAALSDFDAAIAINEGNLDARFERGKLRVQRGEYDGAIEDLSRVLKDNNKVGQVWMWRGAAYDGKGEIEKAKADIKEALARDPKIADIIKGTRYNVQNPVENAALAPAPQKDDLKPTLTGTALDHKNAGNEVRGKNDVDGALKEFNLALIIDPNFADALNNRGSVYTSRGEIDLALADYNRAIEIDPKHRVAYVNRAVVWETLGESEKQMDDLNHAIEFADNDERRASAYSARALARYDAKLYDDSFADAKKATELAPKSAEAWMALGKIQLNFGKSAEAVTSFRRVLEQAKENMAAHVNLSLALALSDDAAAAAEWEQVLKLAEPEELESISDAVERTLKRKPDSALLKAMKSLVDNALDDVISEKLKDTDPGDIFLL